MEPRRTYVVSLYDGSVVVEAVQRDERARITDLDELPERIRKWEGGSAGEPGADDPRVAADDPHP